jgi:superfamily II DNA/RNA helicase
MPGRDVNILRSRMQRLLDGRSSNRLAQAHARALLVQFGSLRSEWPAFDPDLDERLVYSADTMLSEGLECTDTEGLIDLGRQLLVRGAEAHEFMGDTAASLLTPEEHWLRAAVAYQIAGYHARAYVLAQRLRADAQSVDQWTRTLTAFLRRDLRRLSAEASAAVFNSETSDSALAATLGGLADGAEPRLGEDDAVAALGRRSLASAMLLYIEYLKGGREPLLVRARSVANEVALLGRDARQVDLWWWGRALAHLLREAGDSGIWRHLPQLSPLPTSPALQRYIESHVTSVPAVTCLWPSQLQGMALITASARPSFCLRMPTSAGKTKIAELAIIEALARDTSMTAKCIYVAPYRALAIEVERTLSAALRPFGARVSEIYGGFDLTDRDTDLIADTQVLITTPEKLDAVMRLKPELLDNVSLVVMDEGHLAGDGSGRGLRFETLITRLIRRFGRTACRYLFVSAVLPNVGDFAQWLGGSVDAQLVDTWRPTRLLLGECQWNGRRVRVAYTQDADKTLDPKVFVPKLVEATPVQGIAGAGRRRNAFPHDRIEAFATTALTLTRYGATLVFVPQAQHVESTARQILEAKRMIAGLAAAGRWASSPPDPSPADPFLKDCLIAVRDELGPESGLIASVEAGIAVHHSRLPTRVRHAMEALIRNGTAKMIVATTTLGQGVNLPIRTVLVRGLQQGQSSVVDHPTFWNIAGRAGRATKENEGQVLFFIDETESRERKQRVRAQVTALCDKSRAPAVIGALHRLLQIVRQHWKQYAPNIGFDALCLRIAEDDFDWAGPNAESLADVFKDVDQHLLAILSETGVGPQQLDQLQSVLRDTLLAAQLTTHPIGDMGLQEATKVMDARAQSVWRRVPTDAARARFYRMGLSISDCAQLEAKTADISVLMERFAAWYISDDSERLAMLADVAELALTLDASQRPDAITVDAACQIVRMWLSGMSVRQMLTHGLPVGVDTEAGKLSQLVEHMCVFGLSWVATALVSHVRYQEGSETGLPAVAELVPGMFKYGVYLPEAVLVAPYTHHDRRLAIQVAAVCPHGVDRPDRVIAWFHAVPPTSLQEAGMSLEDANMVAQYQTQWRPDWLQAESPQEWRVRIALPIATSQGLDPDTPLLVLHQPAVDSRVFEVMTLDGRSLGRFRSGEELPPWIGASLSVRSRVASRTAAEGDRIAIVIAAQPLFGA